MYAVFTLEVKSSISLETVSFSTFPSGAKLIQGVKLALNSFDT